MRILVAAAAIVLLMLMPRPGAAQEYPWCAIQWDGDGGEISTCGYVSRQQCMDTVGGGVGGYCRPNGRATIAPQPSPVSKKKRQQS